MKNKQVLSGEEYKQAVNYAKNLPQNPCKSCGMSKYGCCGCREQIEYRKVINEIEDLGLYDIVMLLKKRDDLIKQQKMIEQEIEKCKEELKRFSINI